MASPHRRGRPQRSGDPDRQKIIRFLWFDGQAEEAARFYVSLFPNSQIDVITRSPADTPSGPAGVALTVEFTLSGARFVALNGGPQLAFAEAGPPWSLTRAARESSAHANFLLNLSVFSPSSNSMAQENFPGGVVLPLGGDVRASLQTNPSGASR